MSGEIQVRALGAEEVPAVHRLWEAAGLPFHPEGRDSAARMSRELEEGSALLIGAFRGKELVGAVLGTDDGRKGWINRLAVAPSCRREGIGARLIAACEEAFLARGRGIIACLVEDWNDPSLALFQREGYVLRKDIHYLRKMPGGEAW
jgi:ribosomal protein S18 acetylase RimI-like enzyme